MRFSFDILKAKKVTLGVLENNLGAYHCYEAVGFRAVPAEEPKYYHMMGRQVECLEMQLEKAGSFDLLKSYQ